MAAVIALWAACATPPPPPAVETCPLSSPWRPTPVQAERDEIFTLVAYAVALRDWQGSGPGRRGANVAAVLVDRDDHLVCWARNAHGLEGDVTQHAERRLISNVLAGSSLERLDGHRLYTTLEPCPMCAGTALMAYVDVTVWGQTDPRFADVFEGLHEAPGPEGCRHTFGVSVGPVSSPIRDRLEAALPLGSPAVPFLWTEPARSIFADAETRLASFAVVHPENARVLDEARAFLAGVPEEEPRFPYTVGCTFTAATTR